MKRTVGRSVAASGRDAASTLAAYDPEKFRESVVEKGAEAWAEGLLESLKPGALCLKCGQTGRRERWAYRLFAECAKLVGQTPALIVTVFQRIGARDEEEARQLIGLAREVSQVDEHASLEAAVTVLRGYLVDHPEEQDGIVQRLVVATRRLPPASAAGPPVANGGNHAVRDRDDARGDPGGAGEL